MISPLLMLALDSDMCPTSVPSPVAPFNTYPFPKARAQDPSHIRAYTQLVSESVATRVQVSTCDSGDHERSARTVAIDTMFQHATGPHETRPNSTHVKGHGHALVSSTSLHHLLVVEPEVRLVLALLLRHDAGALGRKSGSSQGRRSVESATAKSQRS